MPYLTTTLTVRHPKLPAGALRELRTSAEALDLLGEGEVARAADTLAQRFKAVETSLDADWSLASGHEIVDEQRGIASLEEQMIARGLKMFGQLHSDLTQAFSEIRQDRINKQIA